MIIYYSDKYKGGREESRRLLEKAFAVHTGDEKRAGMLVSALKKGEYGKPYIEGFSFFSVSHTGNMWAVLITDRECGLDIQFGKKCDMNAIASRWYAPQDAAEIAALSAEENYSAAYDSFFRIWTRREALTKAIGSTVYDSDLPAVRKGEADISGRHYTIKDVLFPDMLISGKPDLYAAACIEGDGEYPEISFITL